MCSLKCAIIIEFKEVLEQNSSIEDALPKLTEKISGALNSLAQSSLPLVETSKGLAFVSNKKYK